MLRYFRIPRYRINLRFHCHGYGGSTNDCLWPITTLLEALYDTCLDRAELRSRHIRILLSKRAVSCQGIAYKYLHIPT